MLQNKCTDAQNRCVVKNPGWLDRSHPTVYEGVVEAQVYFYQFYCASDYGSVRVRNCGSYYVYQFTYLPYWSCDYGICMVPHA